MSSPLLDKGVFRDLSRELKKQTSYILATSAMSFLHNSECETK